MTELIDGNPWEYAPNMYFWGFPFGKYGHEYVIGIFKDRFGIEPEIIAKGKTYWIAGPVSKEMREHSANKR